MKPGHVNRAVSLVRIAGKQPVHTERETFRSCVMQTAILRDGRCCFCSPLSCRFRRVPVTLLIRRASAPFNDVIFKRSTPATEGVVEKRIVICRMKNASGQFCSQVLVSAAVWQRQRQADGRQPLIAVEQRTALVVSQDGPPV